MQGVGYPNPNRSHFRSTEIWQTASDSDQVEKYGWIGRYFDSCCSGADPTVGVVVGNQMPESFYSKNPTGICFNNPANYRFLANAQAQSAFAEMNGTDMSGGGGGQPTEDASANSGDSIGMLAAAQPMTGGKVEDFIERTALDAQMSSDKVRDIASRVQNMATYPNSQLGNSLKLVAKLIGGGLPTRIYYVSQGGYDTHTQQAGRPSKAIAGGPWRFYQGVCR